MQSNVSAHIKCDEQGVVGFSDSYSTYNSMKINRLIGSGVPASISAMSLANGQLLCVHTNHDPLIARPKQPIKLQRSVVRPNGSFISLSLAN